MGIGRFGDDYGSYGQIAVPNARTNVGPVAAGQAGPDAYPSTQWQAMTQHVPAGPYVAPVTQYSGPQYGATPGIPPQGHQWIARDGWHYMLYQNGVVIVTAHPGNQSVAANQYAGLRRTPGEAAHTAILKQWVKEHPNEIANTSYGLWIAGTVKAAESPSAASQLTSALSDLAATLTGGAVGTKVEDQPTHAPPPTQAPPPPPPPPGTQMVPFDPNAQMVPPPPPSNAKKYAAVAGGGLLLIGLLGLGYYFTSGGAKTNPDGDE